MHSSDKADEPLFTGAIRIKDYTDGELRHVRLMTEKPDVAGRLSSHPPRPDEDLEFVEQYESPEKLICAFGHPHQRGFVLAGETGDYHLIGCDCARTKYGIEWDKFVQNVQRKVDRQKSLNWVYSLSDQILSAENMIMDVVNGKSVVAFDRLRKSLRQMPGFIFKSFYYQATSADAGLFGTYSERDLKAERLAKEKAREYFRETQKLGTSSYERKLAEDQLTASNEPIYQKTVQRVMTLPCKTLFLKGSALRPRLEGYALELLATARNINSEFNHPALISKSITETARRFDACLMEVDEAISMFRPETLDNLVKWMKADEFRGYHVTRAQGGLSFAMENKEPFLLLPPPELEHVSFSLVRTVTGLAS